MEVEWLDDTKIRLEIGFPENVLLDEDLAPAQLWEFVEPSVSAAVIDAIRERREA